MYKTERPAGPTIRRRLIALAGLLELAEREFILVRHDHGELPDQACWTTRHAVGFDVTGVGRWAVGAGRRRGRSAEPTTPGRMRCARWPAELGAGRRDPAARRPLDDWAERADAAGDRGPRDRAVGHGAVPARPAAPPRPR